MESWDPQAEVIRIAGELGNSHIHEMTDCSPFAKAVLNTLRGRGVFWLCEQLLQGEAQGEKEKKYSSLSADTHFAV